MQRFLLSMLKTWDTSRLSSTDDATVTRYIANSVKNEYIALSKQKAKERGTSYLEDATLPQALEYAQKTSTCDQYDQLTLQDLHKVLNEYEFAIVYAICMLLDCVTGTALAVKEKTWNSSKARKGLWHKGGSTIMICVSVLTDIFLGLVINHVLGLQLPFDYDMLLTPVVLTWYIATELGSILENAAEMGAPVPPVLREVLEKVHKASDRKDTTASAGHQDE